MNTPEQRDELSPEELSRLLRAAVEPIRPSPEAYQRIRTGVERRGRLRAPLYAAGGLAFAAIVAVIVLVVRPSPKSSVVEVQPPVSLPIGSSAVTSSDRPHPSTGPSVRTSSAPGSSTAPGPGSPGSTGPPTGTSGGAATPSGHPSVTRTDAGSPPRPTPVTTPARLNDIDGDGIADSVQASGTSVVVSLSRGAPARLTLPAGSTAGPWTAVDLDDDGFAELVIQTGGGDGLRSYAVARYLVPAELTWLTLPTGQRLQAGRMDVTEGFGFSCGVTGVRIVHGTSSDGGQTYQVTTTPLVATYDGWMQQGDPTTATVPGSAAAASFTANCGTLG